MYEPIPIPFVYHPRGRSQDQHSLAEPSGNSFQNGNSSLRGGGRQVARIKDYYNLDAIIAVGYRVNSKRATQFRIWATAILKEYIIKEYIIKGFAMNDERLKKLQNKMLWAITGKTAAELIASRSNPALPNMGLTTWQGSIVRKGDVATAKNDLQANATGA